MGTKTSGEQDKFINEATHLGLEVRVNEIPGKVFITITEPVDHSAGWMQITATPSKRGHTHTAELAETPSSRTRKITLREAGLTMLKWVGR